MKNVTLRFIEAIGTLERNGDIADMVELFSEECDVGNVVSPNVFFGHEGARDFWLTYRRWFAEVESSIHRVIYSDRHAAIEWSSRGTTTTGHLVAYEGVTILEFEHGKIGRLRAYFNPDLLTRRVRHAVPIGDAYELAFP